jgi:hypothetical protein
VARNAQQIGESTKTREKNGEVIARSTQAIAENDAAVRQSTAAIKESREAIASLTGLLHGLPGGPNAAGRGTGVVVWVLVGAVVLADGLLVVLVVTLVGIRRSLRRLEATVAEGQMRGEKTGA